MNTTLTYGVILALVNAGLALAGYFLGYQTDKMAEGQWFQWLTYAGIIVVITLGIRARREEAPDKSLSYGRGVATGLLISLVGGLLGGIYAFIHFKYVNPSFADYLVSFIHTKQSAMGVPEAQLEQMEKGMRWFYQPVVMAIISPVFYGVCGLIISLIASILLRRPPAQPAAAA